MNTCKSLKTFHVLTDLTSSTTRGSIYIYNNAWIGQSIHELSYHVLIIYKYSIVFFINIDRCPSMFNYLFTPCYTVYSPWSCQLLYKSINQYLNTCNFIAGTNKRFSIDGFNYSYVRIIVLAVEMRLSTKPIIDIVKTWYLE